MSDEQNDLQDKSCQVNIWNVQGWALDQLMLEAVLCRVSRHVHAAKIVEIYPQERVPMDAPLYKNPGYLEWIINITYHTGIKLTIGAIQRSPKHQVEFHS